MNANRFDTYSRMLAVIDTRRGLTRLLLGMPLLGVLGAVLGEASEAGRRHRRRVRHKHRHTKHRRHRKHQPNVPTPHAPSTCASPCPVCQTCNSAGQCVADPSQNRVECAGSTGATSVCCHGTCCAGCCGPDDACGACRVFVTAEPRFDGALGGLTGAAAKCRDRALAGGLPGATIDGNYQAWLSDSTGSPASRFRCTQASCSAQGYVLVDGTTMVAQDWSDLTTCDGTAPFACLTHAIDRTELGAVDPLTANTWTHTESTGTAGGVLGDAHCQNWSTNNGTDALGNAGFAILSDAGWTRVNALGCNVALHLYCFQQS